MLSIVKQVGQARLLSNANKEIKHLSAALADLKREKEQKLTRQVELWSILNLSSELEKEYHTVALDIAILVQRMLSIEKYRNRITAEAYKLRERGEGHLPELMAMKASAEQVLTYDLVHLMG